MEAQAALQMAGTIYKGVSANQSNIYNARVADANAITREREGVAEEARIRDVARQAIGQQVAAQSENGFLIGSGSATDALFQSQVNATLDALTVRSRAASAAVAEREKAKQSRAAANEALVSTAFNLGSDIVGNKTDWASARAGQSGGYGGYGGPTDGSAPTWGQPGHEDQPAARNPFRRGPPA